MLKKIVVAASAAAVVLGAGTAALASSGSAFTSGRTAAPSASSAAPGAQAADDGAAGHVARGNGRGLALRALRGALHAQWVTREGNSTNTFLTHDAIRGVVTAVSAGSITVKAADGVSQSYAVTSATKVHLRHADSGGRKPGGDQGTVNGGGKVGTISDVHTGDKVAVIGTGTTSLTARQVLDRVQ